MLHAALHSFKSPIVCKTHRISSPTSDAHLSEIAAVAPFVIYGLFFSSHTQMMTVSKSCAQPVKNINGTLYSDTANTYSNSRTPECHLKVYFAVCRGSHTFSTGYFPPTPPRKRSTTLQLSRLSEVSYSFSLCPRYMKIYPWEHCLSLYFL